MRSRKGDISIQAMVLVLGFALLAVYAGTWLIDKVASYSTYDQATIDVTSATVMVYDDDGDGLYERVAIEAFVTNYGDTPAVITQVDFVVGVPGRDEPVRVVITNRAGNPPEAATYAIYDIATNIQVGPIDADPTAAFLAPVTVEPSETIAVTAGVYYDNDAGSSGFEVLGDKIYVRVHGVVNGRTVVAGAYAQVEAP